MRRRLPPLNSLRAFEALGRHGKLADAADELCVTVGAVSRHIGILEEFVGFKLFLRHARGLTLTDDGAVYLRSVGHCFDQLDCATNRLLGMPKRDKLSVRVFTTFASEWLVPRLPEFLTKHPEIDFRLSSSLSPSDIDRDDVDIAIRRGPIGPDMDAIPLYHAEYYPVCSPTLIRGGTLLRAPEDIRLYPLLNTVQQQGNWRTWLDSNGVGNIDSEKHVWFDNASLAFQAAREGAGIALGQRHYLVDDFLEGRLLAPFHQGIRSRLPFYLVYAKRDATNPHITSFKDWLLVKISETEKRSMLIQDLPTRYFEVH
ncbi:transcriptional regulator [Caballeronia sordidicola]|uniref:Transcriptional regulator n=1 Tax=Caballeronia sordidicola TaxID=196367 RepID=A0A158HZR3_CABSO|nr:transcriptional regulator GcvA [Caballeronia sordidicola]SAL49865.1 transcriptional regulator [Caballeronia sordidicola]